MPKFEFEFGTTRVNGADQKISTAVILVKEYCRLDTGSNMPTKRKRTIFYLMHVIILMYFFHYTHIQRKKIFIKFTS